jgi:hypothetical protein
MVSLVESTILRCDRMVRVLRLATTVGSDFFRCAVNFVPKGIRVADSAAFQIR